MAIIDEQPPESTDETLKEYLSRMFRFARFEDADHASRLATLEAGQPLWVLFDGVTATIIASVGISGVFRLAQGRYSIVFTNPMNNANYATFINVNEAEAAVSVGGAATDLSETVTGLNIFTTTVSSATSQYKDFNRVSVSIIGGMF